MKCLTFSLLALLASAALAVAAPPPKSVVPAKAPPQCVLGKSAACQCAACGCVECDCAGGVCKCPNCMAVSAPRADGKVQFCTGGTCYLLTPEQAKDKGLLEALKGSAAVPAAPVFAPRTGSDFYTPVHYGPPAVSFGSFGSFGNCPSGG